MKNLVDGREFHNLKEKAKKIGREYTLLGVVLEKILGLIVSMEGQIISLNNEIEKLKEEKDKHAV